MAEKTYPIMYNDKVVGHIKFTGLDFEPTNELVPILDDSDNLEGFEVYL